MTLESVNRTGRRGSTVNVGVATGTSLAPLTRIRGTAVMRDDQHIFLHDVKGLGEASTLLDGVDQAGDVWVFHRLSGKDRCAFCDEPVIDGWTCLRTSAVVCSKHATIRGKMR